VGAFHQRLKPDSTLGALFGTAEVVPFPVLTPCVSSEYA
jgi:hypothetical protein